MSDTATADERLRQLTSQYAQLFRVPPRDKWRYSSLADLVLDLNLGRPYTPAPLPGAVAAVAPGRCFAAATQLADTAGYTYVEGLALTLDGMPFDHAWCADGDDIIAIDPSIPSGFVVAYLGVGIADNYRRAEQTRRGTHAVITTDTGGFTDNTEALRHGLGLPPVCGHHLRDHKHIRNVPLHLLHRTQPHSFDQRVTDLDEVDACFSCRARPQARPQGRAYRAPPAANGGRGGA